MRRLLLVSSLLLLAHLPALAAPPAEAIGRLNYAGYKASRHCTAFLVGARVAVTAAHCVTRLRAGDLHLLLGYDRGAWQAHLRASGLAHDAEGADIAALCLKAAAAAVAFPWSEAAPRRGETLVVWGYGRPRIHALTRRDCTVLASRGRQLILDCNVAPGTSGAPVLRPTATGYEVVAVVSASRGATAVAVRPAEAKELAPCGG
ncbi:MAG: trypsin-like peptidase domain-containing protein [Kiloniellales bacterium]|nr:trypsin-like peptidase domain-containing protein [Kiloniellales bacterium]